MLRIHSLPVLDGGSRLIVEIAYALPYYEKKGDGYRLVRRGAVLLSIFQSPIITLGKTFQTK